MAAQLLKRPRQRRGPRCPCLLFEGGAELLDHEPQSIVAAARRLRSACFLFTLSIALAHALWAAGCPFRRPTFVVLRGMTTGKFVMGILTRLSISRCAVWAQAEHRRVWRSIPHSVVVSVRTSISRIAAPHAKHFIAAPGTHC